MALPTEKQMFGLLKGTLLQVYVFRSSTDLLHHVLLLHLALSELLEQDQASLLETQLLSQSFDHLLPLFSSLSLQPA